MCTLKLAFSQVSDYVSYLRGSRKDAVTWMDVTGEAEEPTRYSVVLSSISDSGYLLECKYPFGSGKNFDATPQETQEINAVLEQVKSSVRQQLEQGGLVVVPGLWMKC